LTSQCQSENAAQNLSMLQNSTGVIRPCPQYSMGQNIPEGNFPPQYGSIGCPELDTGKLPCIA
jgi:hypothetical protein